MKFDRSFIIKAVAAIIIFAFVLELFVVLTYAPQNQPVTNNVVQPPAANITSGTTSVAVRVKNFQPNLLFACNTTQSLTEPLKRASLIAGSAVQIGSNANGGLYTVRVVNVSETANAAMQVEDALSDACSNLIVLRQADVVFNASKGANFTVENSTVLVSKYALDAYKDQYGRIPVALISNQETQINDVILVQGFARLQAGRIVPGSLILEQAQETPQVKQFQTNAKVISVGDTSKIDFTFPWEARNFDFSKLANLNATATPQVNSIIVFNSNDSNVANVIGNATGVISAEVRDGKIYAAVLSSFTDKSNFESIASKYNAPVEFPTSRALIQVSASNLAGVVKVLQTVQNSTIVSYVDGQVEAINFDEFTLGKFAATLYANATVDSVVAVKGFALVIGSKVGQVSAVQE